MHHISILHAIILGIIQGATEFLPISSSGHLVLAQNLLGVDLEKEALLAFDIALHFGTLLALLLLFRKDLKTLIQGAFQKNSENPQSVPSRKLLWYLFLATLPAVVIGLAFKDFFEEMMTDTFSTGVQFIITGFILWSTRYARFSVLTATHMRSMHALIIGVAQAIAIIPAISRSGTTIAAALLLRFDREFAARFSFLLAIPALGGATLLSLDNLRYFSSENLLATLIGTVVSFIVAIGCIKWLMTIIKKGQFSWFAIYCWIIGLCAIFLA
ncbi:MAG: hypothetical protein A3I05_06795 [Deltaproteobacteria bacterium RIFCSPLOWO2_02_FULL_44_10]|nr:MAG: hypothetical protein A3C46_06985 [Deltaproteobacteria bacterium RIFCSPHIGHO2_02_FULL_44_16]OGQ46731.1 MAG: hypothetical protein A3I05_06795 [Deltaproteobacteria bacterium RIFCSPLOWO2_02_FULL_44_10]